MIKYKKVLTNLPSILIVVAILLLLINDKKSEEMNFSIGIIIVILILVVILLDLYKDIKNRKYSTANLIMIANIVEIIVFIALCYLHIKNVDKTNIELLWERAKNIKSLGLIMIFISVIKSILKSQRFEINKG